MTSDPHGYYSILGLQAQATPALIRAAYRVRAMELHPDRNRDPSATREFQKLQEAFDVLSDPAKRAAYDRVGQPAQAPAASDAAPGPRDTDSAPPEKRWEPILCSRCNAQSALPRFRVFYSVRSFLVTSIKKPHQGVYCSKCEVKIATQDTLTTLIIGWWSVYGFFWTIEALIKNLVAGPDFIFQDVRLLAHQAMYFASVGKIDLARAIAIEAYDLSNNKHAHKKLAAAKKKVGADGDPLSSIRQHIKAFIDDTASQSSPLRLKNPSGPFTARTGAQLALITVFAVSIGSFVYVGNLRAEEDRQQASLREQERLVREGIARQVAAGVSAKKAEALRELERAMPTTGEFRRYWPDSEFVSPGGLPHLRVTAPAGTNYYIKLSESFTNQPVTSLFVRAGQMADIAVPFGTFRVTMASGTTWYGDKVRFGPDTQYSQVPDALVFAAVGDRLQGHELLLTLIRNGNLSLRAISPDEF
ncbi:MAG: DnaJ domain-containing protein [Burkholderiales bacterium]|nr:DnaJ domain-containing protein [Burkholderiales bacterium]